MKNADMPAAPCATPNDPRATAQARAHGVHVPDFHVHTGVTKRELMAMNAPEMPDWFIGVWRDRNNIQPGCSVSSASMTRIYFEWRVYYADQLLVELACTKGESK